MKITDRLKSMRLGWKILLSNMLLAVFTICFLSMVALAVSQNILVDQVSRNNSESVLQVKNSVELVLDYMVERLNTLYADADFMNKFRSYSNICREVYEQQLITNSRVLNDYYFLMDKLARTEYPIKVEGYYMFAVTNQAIPYASWGKCDQDLTEFTENCEQLFSSRNSQIIWLTTHRTIADSPFFPDNTKTFSAVKKVTDMNKLKTAGYMVISISEKNLYDTYKELIQKQEGTKIYIIDENGNQVSGMVEDEDDEQVYRQILDELTAQTAKSNDGYFFADVDGKQNLVTYSEIYRNGWIIIHMMPFESLMAPIKFLQFAIVLAVMIALIIALAISFLISRSVSNRLNRLKKVMQEQGENGPMTYAAIDYNDEIGELAIGYNQMADRINHYSAMIVEEQKKKREMELSFLQIQINSHFLYNTLNSVKILARLGMNDRISGLITSLIQLLKLTSSKTDLITIEREIQNIRYYVYIQKIRYLDRFDVFYDYEPWISDYQIPKLLLQPIIENAIFHGISDLQKKGRIVVKVEKDDKDILIRISDNGKGIPSEILENVMSSHPKMNQIGLHNIDERIKIYFGQEYGIRIESEVGKGTTVMVKIGALPV